MRKFLIILISILLLSFISGKNSSNTLHNVEMEKLDISQYKKLSQLFYADKVNRIDSFLKFSQKYYGFNGNVLVAHNGELILKKSYGYSSFPEKEELKDTSTFQLASVSKQFTALAILMLKEQSKLNLDDDIRIYLPNLPYKGVTIKNLLQHTAGLPNYMWMLEHNWKSDKLPTNKDVVRLLSELNLPVYFSPGRKHEYSNTGYVLLASIIEVVTKQPFEDFIQNNIFSALGMCHSFIHSAANIDVQSDYMLGYFRRWHRYRPYGESLHDGIVGDKGVYSTTGDLFLWDQALYDNKLISEESTEEAFTKGKIRNRWSFSYGYGFRIKNIGEHKVIYHNGLWEGFRSAISRFIDSKNTVIVLNNTSCRSMYFITKKIEQINNEDIELAPEYQIIRTAINYGYGFGIERYEWLKKKDPSLDLDEHLFAKVVDNLRQFDKKKLASIVSRLSQDINS